MKHDPITPPPLPPLIDNFGAPEIFATGIAGMGLVHGALLLTLENIRCDHTRSQPTLERVVATRLTLTLPAAQALAIGLQAYLEQNGVAVPAPFMASATRQ